MKVATLPSGAKLEITMAPFEDANKLKKIIAREFQKIKLTSDTDIMSPIFYRDLICVAMSSDDIEVAIWNLMKRCTYNNLRINKDTFESEESRVDYDMACYEVATENLAPFMKGLSSKLGDMFQTKPLPT